MNITFHSRFDTHEGHAALTILVGVFVHLEANLTQCRAPDIQ